MNQPECSVEELRELIAVPRIERVLRAYARAHVEVANWIEACLKFRKAVAEEFERPLSTSAEGIDRRAPGGGSECFPAL
jgi:hypothetical protein